MALTSKSPKAVVLAALATARRALPAYSHKCSPKTFTQHQLFSCLVLKNFLKTDYRGVVAHLADHASLARPSDFQAIPHFTTVQKAARRLLKAAPPIIFWTPACGCIRVAVGESNVLRSTPRVWSAARPAVTLFAVAPGSLGPGKPWFIIIIPSWASSATLIAISSLQLTQDVVHVRTLTNFSRSCPRRCRVSDYYK